MDEKQIESVNEGNDISMIPLLISQTVEPKKTHTTIEPMPKFRKLSELKFRDIKFKLVLLSFTLGGFVSDFYNGTSFISGQYYKKHVTNPSDPHIHSECILENVLHNNDSTNHSVPEISESKLEPAISIKSSDQEYEYSCFEKDPFYGALTLAMLFLPGFFSIYDINEHLSSLLEWSPSIYLLPVLYLMNIFCFPAVFLTFKILHIFLHPGNVLEHIATRSDQAKALFEDSPQLALQLYILLCEADRRPRTIQLIAIAFTCLNIAIPSVKTFLLRKNILHINTETKEYWINHVLKNYLVFLLIALFRISSFSFLICLIRYNAIFIYLVLFVCIRIFLNIASVLEESTGKPGLFQQLQGEGTKSLFLNFFSIHDIRRGKYVMLFYMSLWLIFYLISTIILMVMGSISESDSSLNLFFWPSVKLVTWNELFIIKHISLLFTTGILAICFGIISYLLFIFKIFLPFNKEEEESPQQDITKRIKGKQKNINMKIDEEEEESPEIDRNGIKSILCTDGHKQNLDISINDAKLQEGNVPKDILRLIWDPYTDRTHFQDIYESEKDAERLNHMTLLVDPWEFTVFANKYLDKDKQINIKKYKNKKAMLKQLMSTFNPDHHIIGEENKDIGKEICFRAKMAKEFLDSVKHAESELGEAEEKVKKLQRRKRMRRKRREEKIRNEVTDVLKKENEETTRKEVETALQKQREEFDQKQTEEMEKEKSREEEREKAEKEAAKVRDKKERENKEAKENDRKRKITAEAEKKYSVHTTISTHIASGKSILDIYFNACIRGALLSVQDVLDRGFDINAHFTKPPSPQWWTALHLAAANGQDDVVKLLVEKGMNINVGTSAMITPLRFAAMYGHLSTCKLLLELGAWTRDIKGFDGKTGKEWITEKKQEQDWGKANVSGYPDKFAENTSNQHQDIIELLLNDDMI